MSDGEQSEPLCDDGVAIRCTPPLVPIVPSDCGNRLSAGLQPEVPSPSYRLGFLARGTELTDRRSAPRSGAVETAAHGAEDTNAMWPSA